MYLSLPLNNQKRLDYTCVKNINALFNLEKSAPKLSSEKYRELYLLYGKYMKYSCLMFDCLAQILICESLKIIYFMRTNMEEFHMWIIEISYFIWEHFSQDFKCEIHRISSLISEDLHSNFLDGNIENFIAQEWKSVGKFNISCRKINERFSNVE